jgi:Ni/Co efflux regulator RcnB
MIRMAYVFALAAAMAVSATLPASAQRFCNQNCIGPLCNKNCTVRDRDVTVGRGVRDRGAVIEERRRYRTPDVEIRRSRPAVGVDIR